MQLSIFRLVLLGLILVLALNLTGCGNSGSDSIYTTYLTPTVNVTGIWKGNYTSSVTGAQTTTLDLVQNGKAVIGKNTNSAGVSGMVVGTISANIFSFTISLYPDCTGEFAGTGTVNEAVFPNTMTFTYRGAASAGCGGSENVNGILLKQFE
jgi:hypothetical protein